MADAGKVLRYILGDKLQQHVAATRRSDKSLHVYWRIFVKILVFPTEFLSQQHCAKNQIRENLCDLSQRQNSVAETKIFTKFLSSTKRFVAAMCRRNRLLQLDAGPVHTERSVSVTCCCNLSPSVYRPLIG